MRLRLNIESGLSSSKPLSPRLSIERDQAREMMRNRLCGHERRLRQATGHEHMDFETLKMISPPRPVRVRRHAAS